MNAMDVVTLLSPGMGEPLSWQQPSSQQPSSQQQDGGMPGVDIVQHGRGEILIVASGPVAGAGMRVAGLLHERGFGVTVAKSRWVIPVRAELLSLVTRHRLAVTIEDAGLERKAGTEGGAGPALVKACAGAGITTPVRTIRLPRGFFEHREVLLTIAGLIGVDAALAGRSAVEKSSAAEMWATERNGSRS
jgi:1-deoxy-D-xylulose-5-phosphate synthase